MVGRYYLYMDCSNGYPEFSKTVAGWGEGGEKAGAGGAALWNP